MALKLVINISKKIPGPLDFSSIQASCSIEGELTAGQDPTVEAARIFAQAEAAVDRQLGLQAQETVPQATLHQQPSPSSTTSVGAGHASRPQASQPYRSNGQRRAPAPVTDSQIRFLERLIRDTGTDLNAILQHHQVGSLRDLSCKAAAGLIDEMKLANVGTSR